MGRLVRMEGGPTTATAVMATRRRTRPREAPSIGLLGAWLTKAPAVAQGQATPVEDLVLVVGPTAKTTAPNALREVRGPGPGPRSGLPQVGPTLLARKELPAAGATLATGELRTTPTGRAARAPRPSSATPRRGVVAPRPAHGVGPTPVGAVRVALVVGGLRRGAMAVAAAMVPRRRPVGLAGKTPVRLLATCPTSSAARPRRREPLVPIMVPEEPMAQNRQATKQGPLVRTRMATAIIVREAIRVAGVPFAVVAIRLGPAMAIEGNGVIEAVRLAPTRVAANELRLNAAKVDATTAEAT